MTELLVAYWGTFSAWIGDLSLHYGVDPLMFAFFYVGLAPLVWISAALAVRNLKNDKPANMYIFITLITFLSPYLYIIYSGENIPLWVYGIISILIIFGIYNLWNKIRSPQVV